LTMASKSAPFLTVITVMITTAVAAYVEVGPGPFVELALVSALSLACWLRFSFGDQLSQDRIVGPYLLVIVMNLALNTCRYWSNHARFINEHLHSLLRRSL
jgi:hypothetical protein